MKVQKTTLRLFINKFLKVIIVSLIVFIFDITIKLFVGFNNITNFVLFFLKLHFTINTRIADINIVILLLGLLLILFICFIYVDKNIGLAFVFAGCIANFIDYLIWGCVIDTFKISNIVFNIADLSILFGLLLAIVLFLKFLIQKDWHIVVK